MPGISRVIAARIFLFSALLFFLELLFFRVLSYLTHYLESMLIIGYALAGVAAGALAAARLQTSEARCYPLCLAGTYLCLLLSLWKVLKHPSLGPDNLVLIGMFAFPAYYLARAFQSYPSGEVYLFDLAGPGAAVLLVLAGHKVAYLEQMLIATAFFVALLGLGYASTGRPATGWRLLFCLLCLLAGAGLSYETRTGRLNLYHHVRPSRLSAWKEFGKGYTLARFYDNLIGRVEVHDDGLPGPRYGYVSSGVSQDGFRPDYPPRYRRDPRLVGGFFQEPRIFIIGSSAEGVIKTARYMTRPERIDGSEVNPAVFEMMTRDFVKESGYAYMGLGQRLGNALVLLSQATQRYDIITLMNPHSSGQMFLHGPPDWLHTRESYELYLRCLSEKGYLMVEERPMTPVSFMILFKRLATIHQALQRSGAKNPADHIFVYSWHWNRYEPYEDFTGQVFTSILVKKEPLTSQDKRRLLDWLRVTGLRWTPEGKRWTEATAEELARSPIRFDYLPGIVERPAFAELFTHLDQNTVPKAYAGWDLSPVTDDRPFSAAVDQKHGAIKEIVVSVGWLVLLACLPVLITFRRCSNRGFHARACSYQLLAGAAYILVEVYLMQLYQKVVLSPNVAFVGVLSILLLSSGVGGQVLYRYARVWPVYFGFLASLPAHLAISHMFTLRPPGSDLVTGLLIAAATAWTGFMMGAFLPLGLHRARQSGHGAFIGEYFAMNSVGGTLALAASLYLPVVLGFKATLGIAALCYGLVTLAAGGLSLTDH